MLRDEEVLSDDHLDEEPLLGDGSETITELFQSKICKNKTPKDVESGISQLECVTPNVQGSIINHDKLKVNITIAQHLTVSVMSQSFIDAQQITTGGEVSTSKSTDVVTISDEGTTSTSSNTYEVTWTEKGGVCLTRKHMQLIVNGSELSDLHINAFQNLVK